MRLALFLTLLLAPALAGATSLSVVPLAKALQNPDLDSRGDITAAQTAILAMLLNQPANSAESERFKLRLAQLVRHRNTRIGKLFFRALESTPDVHNVPDYATDVLLRCERPLALGSSVAVAVRWRKVEPSWLIAEIEVRLHGVAAATVVNCAPYFGDGQIRPELLNLPELDYLVGRDAAERIKPASEQAPFSFEDGLARCLELEAGAMGTALDDLLAALKPGVDPAKRLAAIEKHLRADDAKALRESDNDPKLAKLAYARLQDVLTRAKAGPEVSAVPSRTGGSAVVTITNVHEEAVVRYIVERKADGQITLNGEWRSATGPAVTPPATPKEETPAEAPAESPAEEPRRRRGDGQGNRRGD